MTMHIFKNHKISIIKFSLSLCLVLATLFCCITGFSDEFSGHRLWGDWEYATNPNTYIMTVRNNEDAWEGYDRAPKRLRNAISTDWIIETHISYSNEPVGGANHVGLVIYKDSNNWILWGIQGNNSVYANGVMDGTGYNIASIETRYDYLRIEKKGIEYNFYCSDDGKSWLLLPGNFKDINGYFEGAGYGLMGKDWEVFASDAPAYCTTFEYFKETAK